MGNEVKRWMSGSPVSITADASALDAHDRMVQFGIRHLPVIDAESRVIGVLSIDDLRCALPGDVTTRAPLSPEERPGAREWTVGDLMTHWPSTVHDHTSLSEAADLMADRRIGCLPVVDADGRLTGILSETDALRALAAAVGSADRVSGRGGSELDHLVHQLREERARIAGRLDTLHATERELSCAPHDQPMDQPEAGADLREVRLAERLDELSARRLEAIDRALDHAEQGRLSLCDRCGGTIPVPRLRALPGTTLCVACARSEEEGAPREEPFERPHGGRAETGRPELGARVYTRFGEGVLLRVVPFGTCSKCGDVEGVFDRGRDQAVCGRPRCRAPLSDVRDRAIVALGEREAYVDPAELRRVDPAPYD